MTSPVRLQLSRARGFYLQAASFAINGLAARSCARPGRYGNLWRVGLVSCSCRSAGACSHNSFRCETAADAVAAFTAWRDDCERNAPIAALDYYAQIRGLNLACWCVPADPCHVDVLLDRANSPRWSPW